MNFFKENFQIILSFALVVMFSLGYFYGKDTNIYQLLILAVGNFATLTRQRDKAGQTVNADNIEKADISSDK